MVLGADGCFFLFQTETGAKIGIFTDELFSLVFFIIFSISFFDRTISARQYFFQPCLLEIFVILL
jgi:hypothetical protein